MRNVVVLMPRLLSGRANSLDHFCFGQYRICLGHKRLASRSSECNASRGQFILDCGRGESVEFSHYRERQPSRAASPEVRSLS